MAAKVKGDKSPFLMDVDQGPFVRVCSCSFFQLHAGPYLIVITKKKKVGEINGQTIWEMAGTEVLSYKRTSLHLNEQQVSGKVKFVHVCANQVTISSTTSSFEIFCDEYQNHPVDENIEIPGPDPVF